MTDIHAALSCLKSLVFPEVFDDGIVRRYSFHFKFHDVRPCELRISLLDRKEEVSSRSIPLRFGQIRIVRVSGHDHPVVDPFRDILIVKGSFA